MDTQQCELGIEVAELHWLQSRHKLPYPGMVFSVGLELVREGRVGCRGEERSGAVRGHPLAEYRGRDHEEDLWSSVRGGREG